MYDRFFLRQYYFLCARDACLRALVAEIISRRVDAPPPLRYDSGIMAKFIARKCPKCRNYLGLVVNEPPRTGRELLISGYFPLCAFTRCGFNC
jgi:hypothetical protein